MAQSQGESVEIVPPLDPRFTYAIFDPRYIDVDYATDIKASEVAEALDTLRYLYPHVDFDYDKEQ